jgi:hypothetical protein
MHKASHPDDSMNSASVSDMHIRFSDANPVEPATAMICTKKNRISSTVFVKRIRRSSIANTNNIDEVNHSENVQKKPQNRRDKTETVASAVQRSSVTVVRVSKELKLDETNDNNKSSSNVPQQEASSAPSTVPSKTNRVNVIKIPRKKTALNRQSRVPSMNNVSTIDLGTSFIGMRPMAYHSKPDSLATDGKVNADNTVVVTKLPRALTSSRSRRS